jgi:hypothetical protein
MPISSIERPSKINTNWDFRFETIPSGNPDHNTYYLQKYLLVATMSQETKQKVDFGSNFIIQRKFWKGK